MNPYDDDINFLLKTTKNSLSQSHFCPHSRKICKTVFAHVSEEERQHAVDAIGYRPRKILG
jgi:hypothetical protein